MKVYITSEGFVASHLKKAFPTTDDIEKADVVINTIGILREEKYSFEDSHIKTVKKLIPKVKNKKFIHISALGVQKNHKSKYKHTKALAEEIIKSSLSNYVIIKPSIIMGESQKLYKDLEKFKHLPVIFAPNIKVAPIQIEKLIQFIKTAIYKDLKGEFELCGDIKPIKELFKEVFQLFDKSPLIIPMPKIFFLIMLPILSQLGIMTKDEYHMLEDNICKEENG